MTKAWIFNRLRVPGKGGFSVVKETVWDSRISVRFSSSVRIGLPSVTLRNKGGGRRERKEDKEIQQIHKSLTRHDRQKGG